MLFQNKIAVISGSTSGLGEAIAKKLAAEGARGIIVTGRNAERGERVASELKEMGCQAVFVAQDLLEPDAAQHIFAAVDEHFDGLVHGLVNSAAYTARGSIEATEPEEFDRQVFINLRAPFFLTQAAVKRMQRHKIEGSILNIGSVNAHCGTAFLTAYSSCKGALVTLTKNVAHSQLRHRIRCNILLPGWIDTPAEHKVQKKYHGAGENWLEKAEATMPFGKLIQPEEIADLAALILSGKGGVMTGAVIDYNQHVVGSYD
jgi:NAD(P)-dependent dehydrogenase (short-subunit alcohol dehydrogenase family)